MPVTREVVLSDEDERFLDEHDLDLDAIVENGIAMERRQYRYENPRPILDEDVYTKLSALFDSAQDGDDYGMGAFQSGGEGSAVHGRITREGAVLVKLYVPRFTEVTDEEAPGETAAESGEFVKELASLLRDHIQHGGLGGDDIRFELESYDDDKATFTTTIPVVPPVEP